MTEVLDSNTIKALSVEQRQQIMKLLAKRPHTASEMAKASGKHVTTISQHLDVLEKSSLVKKRESTNKWVYYELTSKGEKLFKPQAYSWVVTLSLSVVLMFIGFLRTTRTESFAGASAPMAENTIAQKSFDAAAAAPIDYLAYIFIVVGLVGLVYVAYTKLLK